MTALDSLLVWLRALAAGGLTLIRRSTPAEYVALSFGFVMAFSATAALFVAEDGSNYWPVTAFAVAYLVVVAAVVIDAIGARMDTARAQTGILSVLKSKPTGAPRVAVFTCRHGDDHRYLYTPEEGWQPAGPVPDQEAAR